MSGSFSYYLETQLLGLVFNGTPYVPGSLFAALFTSAPSPSAPGTELAGNGYLRVSAAFSTVAGTPPATGNTSAMQYPAATADWGILVAAGLFDLVSGGNMIAQGLLVDPTDGVTPRPVTIVQGDIFLFPPGGIQISFAMAAAPPAVPFQLARSVLGLRPQVMRA
jgi:hypothetical protein